MLNSFEATDLNAVRNHTEELIRSAPKSNKPVLIEAPPNSGKTTNAIELALHAEKPVTYLAKRIDLYKQAEKMAEDHDGLRAERVPAPHRDCPTFQGKNNASESAVKSLYAKGYSGREIHLRFPDKAPCGKSCEYFEALERIDKDIESIDLLIGHHSHANRRQYVRNRIVVIDEFNPEPFLTPFPDENSNVIDDPGKIIPTFLQNVQEYDNMFPDAYQDVTDLIQSKNGSGNWSAAVNWFQKHGASRRKAQGFDFLEPSVNRYNTVHAYSPLLTLSLLCMKKVGQGIDVAPPPSGELDEIWNEADLGSIIKCLRDRNTGEMYILNPPDLKSAAQVIGLDGTPTIELWNLLFSPEVGFNHQRVISRDDFVTYLQSAMNMSLIQIGGGMHYYAGGDVSNLDSTRFNIVKAREDDRFALITSKKVLAKYDQRGWLEQFVKRTGKTNILNKRESGNISGYQTLNFAAIKSSNTFEKEALGVVTGMPFPSDDLVRIWAGFCGHAVSVTEDEDGNKSFGDFGDKIFKYFAHHQVVQAVLRFGRDDSVYDHDGATVYISTQALPEWFDVDVTIELHRNTKESAVIAELFHISQNASRSSLSYRTVPQLHQEISEKTTYPNISERGVRESLERLSSKDYIKVREDWGRNNANLFKWNGECEIQSIGDGKHLLFVDNDVYEISVGDSWNT